MTLTFAVRRVVQHGGMKAAHNFDQGGIELSQNATDRRVCWSFPPLRAERIAQPREVDIDEALDRPIGAGAGDDSQDRQQTTCGRRYSFPSARLGSSISVSRSTNELNGAMATPRAAA